MQKMKKSWTGKKEPTNPVLKEQHLDRKTKEELEHRWQNDDWEKQLKDYIDNQRTSSKSF